jgi:hypothetical protein
MKTFGFKIKNPLLMLMALLCLQNCGNSQYFLEITSLIFILIFSKKLHKVYSYLKNLA